MTDQKHRFRTDAPSCFVLLLFAFLLLLCACILGCTKEPGESDPERSMSVVQTSFEEFTDQLFCQTLRANTLNMHYTLANPSDYGIEDSSVSLGSFSLTEMQNSMASVRETLAQLQTYPYDELTQEQQLTYDVINSMLTTELKAEPCLLYTEILSPTTGYQAQLPILLSEYQFYQRQDVEDYLSLLSAVGPLYDQIIAFEREKSAAGLFMPDFAANQIIAQCQALVDGAKETVSAGEPSASGQSHFMQSTFEERLSDLSLTKQETQEYLSRHNQLLTEQFFPAYERLISGLQELLGTGTNGGGLCHYPLGRDYYSYLVEVNTGSSDTVPELHERIIGALQSNLDQLSSLLKENSDLVTLILSGEADEQQKLLPSAPDEILNVLSGAISKDFPELGDVAFQTHSVDDSLKEFLSPAFYLTPTLDSVSEHTIYINDATHYTPLSLFTTLAHEGFPGHLYQNAWVTAQQLPSVRALFCPSGYSEGWATYAEMYAYDYCGLDEDLCTFARLNAQITLAIYSALDIGIHYYYWDAADAYDFLCHYGYVDESGAEAVYQYIVEEPANYLTYYVGYLEFEQLKEQSMQTLSDQFDLKDFHSQLLSLGEAPFDVLRKHLNLGG